MFVRLEFQKQHPPLQFLSNRVLLLDLAYLVMEPYEPRDEAEMDEDSEQLKALLRENRFTK